MTEIKLKKIEIKKKEKAVEVDEGVYYAEFQGELRLLVANGFAKTVMVFVENDDTVYQIDKASIRDTYSNIKKIKSIKMEFEVEE